MNDAKISSIVDCLRNSRMELSNEKATQADIAASLKSKGIPFVREVRLSAKDIIDFSCDGIGLEVKLRGCNKKAVFKQLTRYAKHESIQSLILVSNTSMGLPVQIEGKDVFYVNIAEGWM